MSTTVIVTTDRLNSQAPSSIWLRNSSYGNLRYRDERVGQIEPRWLRVHRGQRRWLSWHRRLRSRVTLTTYVNIYKVTVYDNYWVHLLLVNCDWRLVVRADGLRTYSRKKCKKLPQVKCLEMSCVYWNMYQHVRLHRERVLDLLGRHQWNTATRRCTWRLLAWTSSSNQYSFSLHSFFMIDWLMQKTITKWCAPRDSIYQTEKHKTDSDTTVSVKKEKRKT